MDQIMTDVFDDDLDELDKRFLLAKEMKDTGFVSVFLSDEQLAMIRSIALAVGKLETPDHFKCQEQNVLDIRDILMKG